MLISRLYLAHPLETREYVRAKELEIEEETGLVLINPFYDTGREDIVKIDAGEITRDSERLDFEALVLSDLHWLEQSDGIVACIIPEIRMVGTLFEIWHATLLIKPVFLICLDAGTLKHPWLKYVLQKTNGRGFNNFDEFKVFLKGYLYKGECKCIVEKK